MRDAPVAVEPMDRRRFERRTIGRRADGPALLVGVVATLWCSPALADLRVDGKWRQGPLREDFTVQRWMNGCGPPPQSSSTGGGEQVSLELQGDELAIVGGGRLYRSNQCYDPMPTLSRESHSRDASGKAWRTRCATPANESRRALLNTLVVATTDTHVDIVETGRYEIVIEAGRCMADVRRTRSFDLVVGETATTVAAATTAAATATAAAATAAAAAPGPEATVTAAGPATAATAATASPQPSPGACASPGEPHKLEVRPSQKLLRTGEAFQFHAVVLDATGCSTSTRTTWRLALGDEGKGVTVDGAGRVTAASGAPEGKVQVVATAAGRDARVVVEITQPAHYDDLLARSGLNASGDDGAVSAVSIGSQSIGAGESRVEDGASGRRLTFLAIIGSLLAVLAAAGLVVLRRSRRAAVLERAAEERHEERVRAVLDRRRARADRHAAQLRAHEESVLAAREAERERKERERRKAAVAKGAERVCPTCAGRFEAPTAFCPTDGAALVSTAKGVPVPAPAVLAKSAAGPTRRGKVCPTCGDRFDGGADYCGKDGTQLVLLN